MAVYLKRNQTEYGSKDYFVCNLFNHLDPEWYPVNVIGSEVYDIFSAYGEQLASASAETRQTFLDLSIAGVRAESGYGRSASKMYDNFGALSGIEKLYDQDYDVFDDDLVLQSYRQELRLLMVSHLHGTTKEAIYNASRAFTGIKPHVTNPVEDRIGWQLTTYYNTISEVTDEFIVLSNPILRIGNVVYLRDTSAYTVGESIILSYSILGVNTILVDDKDYYSGLRLVVPASLDMSVDVSFKSNIEKAINTVLRADIKTRVTYSNNFVYDRPG